MGCFRGGKRKRKQLVVNNAEPIWDSDLQRSEFYAAAYFLSVTQPTQQQKPHSAKISHNFTRRPKANYTVETLLDLVAQLFARMREDPEHVTATCLRKTASGYQIIIAKNGGPISDEDGNSATSDAKIRDHFEKWLNNPGDEANDKKISKDMYGYWEVRFKYYWKEVYELAKGIKTNHSKQYLLGEYRALGLNARLFKEDWSDIKSLLGKLTYFDDVLQTSSALFEQIGRQDYPKLPNATSLPERFRRLVRSLGLLGTIPTLLGVCKKFKDEFGPRKIEVVFYKGSTIRYPHEAGASFPLEKEDIIRVIKSWKGQEAFLEDRKKALDRVINKKLDRYFHCEMQLLNEYLEDEHAYDYFGCSKLSCFMCWALLDGSGFRMKDTHAKIYPDCAFPFAVPDNTSQYQPAIALKSLQDHLTGRVSRRRLETDRQVTTYVPRTETVPPKRRISGCK